VEALRTFRNDYLLTSAPGRYLVEVYYRYSPALAEVIRDNELLRAATRALLSPIVYTITYPVPMAALLALVLLWFASGSTRRSTREDG
jgi:hypothetical protein